MPDYVKNEPLADDIRLFTMPDTAAQLGPPTRVALAQTDEEKERIFAFRYQIYVEELGKSKLSSADHSHR